MSWAGRRRVVILTIIGTVAVAFLAIVLISTVYKTPTCTDNVQNQDEAGIDCGGSCSFLCTAQEEPPTILFTKALTNSEGRTDIVAMVENKNQNAAAIQVPYRVLIYGPNQTLLQTVRGTVDLPPGTKQPIYIPGALMGGQRVSNAFLEIDPTAPKWFALSFDPRNVPVVTRAIQTGTLLAPRVSATLSNRSAAALTNVKVVVTLEDARGEVVGASQTLVPTIPAQGEATATFTWNSAFSGIPASIHVVPIIAFE